MPTLLDTVFMLAAFILLAAAQPLLRRIWRQWSLRKIPGPTNASIVSGNFMQIFHPDGMPLQDHLFATYGSLFRINGYLGEQILVTSDLETLHHIVVKHVDIFDTAKYFLMYLYLSFGRGIVAAPIEDNVHRKQRKLMNPAFSIVHMRRLIPLFNSLSKQVRELMTADIKRTGRAETDVMDYMGRLALELISQGGFGHSFGSLNGGEDVLARALKRFTPASANMLRFRPLLSPLTRMFSPRLLRRAAELLPVAALHEMMDVSDMLEKASGEIWAEKKQAHAEGRVSSSAVLGQGRDILSLLLDEHDKAALKDKIPDKELQAQINTFLFAGSDTTSNALSRILHTLAFHTEAQDKLRQELVNAGAPDTDLEYDTLDRLPYLDAVCRETLRLFAPVPFVQRLASKDHVLPLREPITDVNGKVMSEVFVPKGTVVLCALSQVNRSKAVWGEDALEWKPERWLNPLPQTTTDSRVPGVYSNLLTFSGGSRACIGFKFSLLEMKSVLAQFIPSFKFEISEKHPIVWRFGSIVTPAVGSSESRKAQLPLRVTCI
ncbi:cytochrome P450 [Peniophora sp. CONT]|nr:cytochrome P450 [Peniophora sp. CONT]